MGWIYNPRLHIIFVSLSICYCSHTPSLSLPPSLPPPSLPPSIHPSLHPSLPLPPPLPPSLPPSPYPPDTRLQDFTPRLFELSSTTGEFIAGEVIYHARNTDIEAAPFLQSDLYSATQPGMQGFIQCTCTCLYNYIIHVNTDIRQSCTCTMHEHVHIHVYVCVYMYITTE